MIAEKVGTIRFGGRLLDVYGSTDEPIFKASDVGNLIDYSSNNTWGLLGLCEEDEKLVLPVIVAGQRRSVNFLTETGLYNVLSQSRKPLARLWRRLVHAELINLRKSRGLNVVKQFEDWDHQLDGLYYDEESDTLMQSVTVAGGDVEQIPIA